MYVKEKSIKNWNEYKNKYQEWTPMWVNWRGKWLDLDPWQDVNTSFVIINLFAFKVENMPEWISSGNFHETEECRWIRDEFLNCKWDKFWRWVMNGYQLKEETDVEHRQLTDEIMHSTQYKRLMAMYSTMHDSYEKLKK